MAEDQTRTGWIAVSPQDDLRLRINAHLAHSARLGDLPDALRIRGHSLDFLRMETCDRS